MLEFEDEPEPFQCGRNYNGKEPIKKEDEVPIFYKEASVFIDGLITVLTTKKLTKPVRFALDKNLHVMPCKEAIEPSYLITQEEVNAFNKYIGIDAKGLREDITNKLSHYLAKLVETGQSLSKVKFYIISNHSKKGE